MRHYKLRFLIMFLSGILITIIIRNVLPLPPNFQVNSFRNIFFSGLQSITITFIIWESTLRFDALMNNYFPWEKYFFKRFITVIAGGIIICILSMISVGYFFDKYICEFPLIKNPQIFRVTLIIALIISVMILFIEFGIQIFHKWRASLIQIESYKAETAQAKLENLQNQVNPHFLFNNMSVLSSLIYKDQDKAVDFVHQLSQVYRYLLDNQGRDLVTLEREMEFIETYCSLLQIRYSPNLTVDIKISESYKCKMIPPLAVQLLVENCIKHNEISSAKPLRISISILDDELCVKNPIQRRHSTEKSSNSGLKNIQSRYAFFTEKEVCITCENEEFKVCLPLLSEI